MPAMRMVRMRATRCRRRYSLRITHLPSRKGCRGAAFLQADDRSFEDDALSRYLRGRFQNASERIYKHSSTNFISPHMMRIASESAPGYIWPAISDYAEPRNYAWQLCVSSGSLQTNLFCMATPCGEAHEKDALCHAHYHSAQELPLPAKIELRHSIP